MNPFNCRKCKKTFKYKKNLVRHLKVHADESYRCSICRTKFKRKDVMIKHMKTHDKIHDKHRGSSFSELPPYLKSKKAIVNVRNNDQKSFLWSVLASLHPPNDHTCRVSNYEKHEHSLNVTGISYPVKQTDIPKFEKQNEISINLFGFEKELFPIQITKSRYEKHVNLLVFSSDGKSHYCWIKNFSRLLATQKSCSNKHFFCDYCLHGFTTENLLVGHRPYCQIHGAQKVVLPSKDEKGQSFTGHDLAKELKCPTVNMRKSYLCDICKAGFSRKSSLKRHSLERHREIQEQSAPPPPHPGVTPPKPTMASEISVEPSPHVSFKHPFTMVIAGPTQSGKTTWTRNLIQNMSDWIEPCPQRIVWCYTQWQPMYGTMKGVEFVRDIPPNLEEDGYFDLNSRNLLVLDDLMTEVGKDEKITNLYTKGSHHRNLSVITLMQNFFGHGTKTIRRNSQYLVLFDMPADKQQIHTIAQQTFPRHQNWFLKKYEGAVSKRYGHLVVIHKSNMHDTKRVLPNPTPENTVKDVSPPLGPQLNTNSQTVNISEETSQTILESSYCNMSGSKEKPKFHPCDECGLVYWNLNYLHKHIRKCGSEPPSKKARVENEREVEHKEDSDINDKENPTFKSMWDEARNQANEGQERREFFKILQRYIAQAIDLKGNKTVSDILDKARTYIEKGWAESKAIKRAIRKYRIRFEDIFEVDSDSQEADTEDKTEEEKEEEYI